MEKVLAVRDKYFSSTPTVEQVEELIRNTTVQMGKQDKNEKDRHLEELKKLKMLKEKVTNQQEHFLTQKQSLNSLTKELSDLNLIVAELEAEKNRLHTENCEMESKMNQLKVVKPSVTDIKILEHGRKKLDYYKALTGVSWDYPLLGTAVTGYICNDDEHIEPFRLKKGDPQTEAELWKKIEKSVSYSKNRNKPEQNENSPLNIIQ